MNNDKLNNDIVAEKTEESLPVDSKVELQKQIAKFMRSRIRRKKHHGKCAGAFGKQV